MSTNKTAIDTSVLQNLHPFQDEKKSLRIAGLTIENHLDRVVVFGGGVDLELTCDQAGKKIALSLVESDTNLLNQSAQSHHGQVLAMVAKQVIDVLDTLLDLPEHITAASTVEVANPFV